MSQVNIDQLFQNAQDDGMISPASMQALTVIDYGAQIQNALGMSVDDVQASEVVLATILIDDSGSIRMAGNSQAVRDGHNMVLDALKESKQENSILVHTRYLNGSILYPYGLLSQAMRMDSKNYDPVGGTPLYDQTVATLGTVLVEAQRFIDNAVATRTVTLIVTDGADMGSIHHRSPSSVRPIVEDMLRGEHIIAAMGIDDGGITDFRDIFRRMGLLDQWILTPGNSQGEIRRAFGMFSRSAVRASRNAQSFSQTALGGIGAP